MGNFLHSILAPNQAITADGAVTYTLPRGPLSAILIHINPLNETGAAVTTYRYMAALLGAVVNVLVKYRGTTIIDASGADLGALAVLWHGTPIWQSNATHANNERRSLVLPVLLSRRPTTRMNAFR